MKTAITLLIFLLTITLNAQPPSLTPSEKVLADEIEFDHQVLVMLRNQTKAEFLKIISDDTHEIPAIAIRLSNSDAQAIVTELKNRLLFKGYVLFISVIGNEGTNELYEIRLLKAQDPLIPIKYMKTESESPALTNDVIYNKIRRWNSRKGCTVNGAGKNWLHLKFVLPLKETEELAQDMIEFCPNILKFNGSKENLVIDLKNKPSLYLEW